MPRTPKSDAQRIRPHTASKSTRLTAPATKLKPKLRARPDGRSWSAATKTWWSTIWASPMATLWQAADVAALERLAVLKEDTDELLIRNGAYRMVRQLDMSDDIRVTVELTVPTGTLKIISDLEDKFGLSPISRRRLGIEIDTPIEKTAPQHDEVAAARRARLQGAS